MKLFLASLYLAFVATVVMTEFYHLHFKHGPYLIFTICTGTVCVILAILREIVCARYKAGTVIVSSEGNIVRTFPKTTYLWVWGKENKRLWSANQGNVEINWKEKMEETHCSISAPKHIPGAWNLLIGVRYVVGGSPEKVAILHRELRKLGVTSASEFVEYFIHELGRQRPDKMATFYNPWNQKQQDELSCVINSFLYHRLQSAGITLEDASFQLAT